jgi:hypothetical protein
LVIPDRSRINSYSRAVIRYLSNLPDAPPCKAARLESEQRAIQVEKRIAKSDGKITPGERRILKQEQDRASRDIYRQKHDAQIRG